ncbi:hypothetical protein GCM10017673_37620 [Streptosporangium violaceochromogenes]|nr:hypothetical protein GCM10017673_37620 [Streptosporangium violaceochromogenes]
MQQPPSETPERRFRDRVALALMLAGYAGFSGTLLAVHPLLLAGYVSLSAVAAGVVLGISR